MSDLLNRVQNVVISFFVLAVTGVLDVIVLGIGTASFPSATLTQAVFIAVINLLSVALVLILLFLGNQPLPAPGSVRPCVRCDAQTMVFRDLITLTRYPIAPPYKAWECTTCESWHREAHMDKDVAFLLWVYYAGGIVVLMLLLITAMRLVKNLI